MINKIDFEISELKDMKEYPKEIFYKGNLELLNKPKISIVGTRKPISYTKNLTAQLSTKLANAGICIISGVAMGVDAIAHSSAINSTIAVVANGLNIKYPSVNKKLIEDIEQKALILSTYKENEKAKAYTFVLRNELVVALGDILIITQADLKSGSLRSAEYAIKMGKQIYVLAHRIGDSEGTNKLVEEGYAEVIYDIDKFIEDLGYGSCEKAKDDFVLFCETNPTYDEAVKLFGSRIFESELLGEISIKDGKINLNLH